MAPACGLLWFEGLGLLEVLGGAGLSLLPCILTALQRQLDWLYVVLVSAPLTACPLGRDFLVTSKLVAAKGLSCLKSCGWWGFRLAAGTVTDPSVASDPCSLSSDPVSPAWLATVITGAPRGTAGSARNPRSRAPLLRPGDLVTSCACPPSACRVCPRRCG